MDRLRTSAFSAEQLAQFQRTQLQRPILLRSVCDMMELWRCCGDKSCGRSKRCQSAEATCLIALFQGMPDEERLLWRYAIENRRNGLAPDEAFERAQAKVMAEEALPEF